MVDSGFSRVLRWSGLIATLAICGAALARESPTAERSATVASLFSAAEAASLAATLPPDRPVKFRVRIPPGGRSSGVLVFVTARRSGDLPEGWEVPLDRANLAWISADDFGNDKLSAQRVLVALMGLKLAAQIAPLDTQRQYIGGMSGGGRIASLVMARFPKLFTGALYVVGADFHPTDEPLKPLLAARRYVFITGDRDFNRHEMKQVYEQYRSNGVTATLLMDLPDFGHEYPQAQHLEQALAFLDAR
jgi:predicted esterase